MTALPTLLVDGDASTPRAWSSQAFGDIDEGIGAADGTEIAAATSSENRGTSLDTAFTIEAVPADLGNVDTFSYNVRYRAAINTGDDSLTFDVRVVTSGGVVLAAGSAGGAFETVQTGENTTWSTSLANSGATAFTYVNTGATKAQWDDAQIELRSTHSQNMGPEDNWVIVDTIEFTGTYTEASGTLGWLFPVGF